MSKSQSLPDILSCEAEDLAQYLLSERFSNNSKATATFFLQAISSFPNAEALSAELTEEGGGGYDENDSNNDDLGDPLLSEDAVTEISMISPRGKFSCRLYENGMKCENAKKESFTIQPQDALQLVLFPKPEDIRKKGSHRDMILLTLIKDQVMFKNKNVSQLCFQLPNDAAFLENFRTSLNLTNDSTARVGGGNGSWKFQSYMEGSTSSTTGGMPFVKCYHGVNDGHLYPLQEGLLFFKPALFVPRSSLHSIACGRGASGASRYVDMNITLEDEETLEFTNISREELGPLNEYINGTLIPAMKEDAVEENDNEDDEEETEEEEDNDDDDAVNSSRRSKRKASKEAREATKSQMRSKTADDDDDDDDDDDESWDAPDQQHDEGENNEDDEDDHDEVADSVEGGQGDDDEDDNDSEEVFFEEEDQDETEEEEDDESRPTKRRR